MRVCFKFVCVCFWGTGASFSFGTSPLFTHVFGYNHFEKIQVWGGMSTELTSGVHAMYVAACSCTHVPPDAAQVACRRAVFYAAPLQWASS